MHIKLLKDHNGHKSGNSIDVTVEQANYLIRCKVAEYDGQKPETVKEIKVKKTRKPRAKKQTK